MLQLWSLQGFKNSPDTGLSSQVSLGTESKKKKNIGKLEERTKIRDYWQFHCLSSPLFKISAGSSFLGGVVSPSFYCPQFFSSFPKHCFLIVFWNRRNAGFYLRTGFEWGAVKLQASKTAPLKSQFRVPMLAGKKNKQCRKRRLSWDVMGKRGI